MPDRKAKRGTILYNKEGLHKMKRRTGYKRGYKITIRNGFYDVIDGKRVVYYGKCRRNSTINEIANRTILLNGVVQMMKDR